MFVTAEPLDLIVRGLALSSLAVVWVIFVVRVVGLRAFSKMTAFDFVVTVATGSLLAGASQATDWPEFWQASLAIAGLLGVQYIAARLRTSSRWFEAFVQNEPVLLMRDGQFLHKAMKETRVAKSDVLAKLREANVLDIDEVRAVVLETTGDISVVHGSRLEGQLLRGVRVIDCNTVQ
jgi:uncharacterized membrane protein YcaP (DUF421 family)